jgi:DNA polymerase I-like protein with 3'-5' exonuclease and polymerase domains|nr:MAG TPA: DNA polymerase [Caudoviricetes sp.]
MALSFARPKSDDKNIIKKSKTVTTRTSIRGGGNNLAAQIQSIVAIASQKLAHHKDDYILIREPDQLYEYMKEMKQVGEGALDTETTGLNPLLVDIVGGCIYTPGQKAAYIPINHKSYITGTRTKDQLDEQTVSKIMKEFHNDIRWIFHNAKYDIRVCRKTLGIDFKPYWDTMLAAYCIDENESHALKDLHLKYCDSTDTESLKFDTLFRGFTFDQVPISVAYLYAAGDALKTFELYEYQKSILNRRNGGTFEVFNTIEMPLITVVADMEDRGVCLDFEVCKNLHEKYHSIKEEREQTAQKVISMYDDQIENYKLSHPNCKLSTPVSLTSPIQLAILFYDILKLESPDKKSPRGTGENILKHFAEGKHKDLCNAILDIRNVDKLLSTYVDKMPKVVLEDGRVHANYNQYGAKTGRFSSSDPNLQNIPSHNKEIRQMFKAQDGYVLVGADYSQQEPMVTAHLSNDKKMQDAFIHGKDIYATIASLAFHKPYDECKEFRPDGTVNPAGKERRSQAKSIVLGILYGRQIPSIGEQLGVSTKEAQKIYDSVLKAFPQLAKFIDESQTMAKEKGYVTTAWGRRRHLVDMQLDRYEFTNLNFDPLAFGTEQDTSVPESVKKQYTQKLDKAFGWKRKNDIIQQAYNSGIKIKDNTGFIAQAERQCVNARVQGSAADMVKLAMIHINNDEMLKDLHFHLLLQVHDEVIGECPEENVVEAKERLAELMKQAPSKLIKLPFRCDCEVTRNWYGEALDF